MNTLSIIEALGGREAAATICGITVGAVRKWEINGVPSKHWPAIVAHTGDEVSYEILAASRESMNAAQCLPRRRVLPAP